MSDYQKSDSQTSLAEYNLDWNTLDKLPDAICLIDFSGSIIHANTSFNRSIHYVKYQDIIRPVSFINDFIHVSDRSPMADALSDIQESGTTSSSSSKNVGVCRTLQKIGINIPQFKHYHWVLQGTASTGVLAIGRQVTDEYYQISDQNDVRRQEFEEYVAFLSAAPIPLHWISPSGIVLWANQAELTMLGYSPEEYIGESLFKVISLVIIY